jgi:hypothetical protein
VELIANKASNHPRTQIVYPNRLGNVFCLTLQLANYNPYMKPLPKAPPVPGKTDYERFDNAVRHVLTVSKDDLLKRKAREKRKKERKNKTH